MVQFLVCLPILILFAGVIARVARPQPRLAAGQVTVMAVLIALIAMLFGLQRVKEDAFGGVVPILLGLLFGAMCAYVAAFAEYLANRHERVAKALSLPLLPLALGLLDQLALQDLSKEAWLGSVFGVAGMAWLVGIGGPSKIHTAALAAIFSGCIAFADILGSFHSARYASVGIIFALVALIALFVSQIAGRWTKGQPGFSAISSVIAFVFLTVGAYLLSQKDAAMEAMAPIVALSSAIAVLVLWMTVKDVSSLVERTVLAAIIWIALATASYGYAGAFGMSIALITACATILILGSSTALLSLGPLAAIVVYRAFREMHPETAAAFDIGQHYALIGLLLGLLLPVLAYGWGRKVEAKKPWFAGGLWCILLAAAPIPIAVALSEKGIVGYLIGLGIAPIFEAGKGETSSQSLSLAIGLSSAMAVLYGWLEPYADVNRHAKIIALTWIIAVMAVLVIAILFISQSGARRQTQPESATS